jgi:hypothetical protein
MVDSLVAVSIHLPHDTNPNELRKIHILLNKADRQIAFVCPFQKRVKDRGQVWSEDMLDKVPILLLLVVLKTNLMQMLDRFVPF